MTAIRVVQIKQTCESCPSQWEGLTDDNRRVYVRYRWGWLVVRVGAPGDTDEFAGVRGEEVLCLGYGDDFDGYMTYNTLKRLCAGRVEFPS